MDADAATPSSNTRSYTRRSVPSSLAQHFCHKYFFNGRNNKFKLIWKTNNDTGTSICGGATTVVAPSHNEKPLHCRKWCECDTFSGNPCRLAYTSAMAVPHIPSTDAGACCNPCRAAVRSIWGCLHSEAFTTTLQQTDFGMSNTS